MKISVKTLKGSSFEIEVQPEDTIAEVKQNIESSQGRSLYPAEEQTLIHQGKILKDDTTLAANNVVENNFLVIMKGNKAKAAGTSSTKAAPANQAPPTNTVPPVPPTPALQTPASSLTSIPNSAPTPTATAAPAPAVTVTVSTEVDAYGQAAANLVAGSTLEQTIQQLLDMGGGTWDREMVTRALRAAYNNPERAVEYLYSGIPENIGEPAAARAPVVGADSPVGVPQPVQPAVPSSGPNANPLDLFPQGLPNVGSNAGAGSLDFLRNSPQFRALQAFMQANPQVLQPMLQELAKQNPQLLSLIQEHQGEFLRLMNEPVEGAEGNLIGQLDAMPQSVTVTPEERAAIERLEQMGFDRALVLEVFFACNKNEELAANYLLDHMHEFEE